MLIKNVTFWIFTNLFIYNPLRHLVENNCFFWQKYLHFMLFVWVSIVQKRVLSFVPTILYSSSFVSTDYGCEVDDDDGFWIQSGYGSTSGEDTLTLTLLLFWPQNTHATSISLPLVSVLMFARWEKNELYTLQRMENYS